MGFSLHNGLKKKSKKKKLSFFFILSAVWLVSCAPPFPFGLSQHRRHRNPRHNDSLGLPRRCSAWPWMIANVSSGGIWNAANLKERKIDEESQPPAPRILLLGGCRCACSGSFQRFGSWDWDGGVKRFTHVHTRNHVTIQPRRGRRLWATRYMRHIRSHWSKRWTGKTLNTQTYKYTHTPPPVGSPPCTHPRHQHTQLRSIHGGVTHALTICPVLNSLQSTWREHGRGLQGGAGIARFLEYCWRVLAIKCVLFL